LPEAIGSNKLPRLEAITCRKFNNNRAISDLNFPLVFEFWNLPLPKVQIGS
jgi:hypothetical protein